MRIRAALSVLCVTALAAGLVYAAPPGQIRVQVNLVNLFATVRDKHKGIVTGLKMDDFEVYEDGQAQEITNFSAEKFEGARKAFPFLDSFDGIVVSGRERLLKPDAAIYQLFLERHDLKAADCIFIDDSLKNVEGAKAVGMHGHHFLDAEGLARELRAHGFEV